MVEAGYMEQLSIIVMKKFRDTVERILHVPGNYRGGILEMAVVVDTALNKDILKSLLPQLLRGLKQNGIVFMNVRFNYILWKQNTIETQVCPMMQGLLEGFYESYEQDSEFKRERQKKNFGNLIEYLKLFQARSKIVILLTTGNENYWNTEEYKKLMQPFLDKKLLVVRVNSGEMKMFYRCREI